MKLKEKNKASPVSFWIDSSGGPKELCKNSFYGTNPKYYFYGSLNEVNLYECENGAITFAKENCFDFLEEKISEEKSNPNGIFVGYFSYDLSDFFFAYFDKIEPMNPRTYEPMTNSTLNNLHLSSNMTDAEYLNKVNQIKSEIKAGNVYQVNLTREYSMKFSHCEEGQSPDEAISLRNTVKDCFVANTPRNDMLNDLDLYLKLRSVSPNPYSCFFKTPFVSILSSSPEEFLYADLQSRDIRTRPIKGTLIRDVFKIDPKNQAENIMIVDLERNDLGRICEYGSVQVKKLLEIESYKHLNHVVSTIEGKLKPGVKLKEIFEAVFPGGSITGAPKIAAMKIIEKIEPTKRGAYTGTFGYIKTDGTMNFNILIRTIFVNDGKITFNVGGGIVADSEPESELEEIRLKAEGIMGALNISI